MRLLATFLVTTLLLADGSGKLLSKYSDSDVPLNVDPESTFWSGAPSVIADSGPKGTPEAGYRTEIRSRWTDDNLYFLFICPYEKLHLKPNPVTSAETNHRYCHARSIARPQGTWRDRSLDS